MSLFHESQKNIMRSSTGKSENDVLYEVIRLSGDIHQIRHADLDKDSLGAPIKIDDILWLIESRVDIPSRYLELSRLTGSDILPRDMELREWDGYSFHLVVKPVHNNLQAILDALEYVGETFHAPVATNGDMNWLDCDNAVWAYILGMSSDNSPGVYAIDRKTNCSHARKEFLLYYARIGDSSIWNWNLDQREVEFETE